MCGFFPPLLFSIQTSASSSCKRFLAFLFLLSVTLNITEDLCNNYLSSTQWKWEQGELRVLWLCVVVVLQPFEIWMCQWIALPQLCHPSSSFRFSTWHSLILQRKGKVVCMCSRLVSLPQLTTTVSTVFSYSTWFPGPCQTFHCSFIEN